MVTNLGRKKNTESCFDVTIGSFDGAEICELVGIHVLSLISSKLDIKTSRLGIRTRTLKKYI